MTVSPPTLYWYQLDVGTLAPAYYGQLDTCVHDLCVANSITPQTAPWYNPIGGTLNNVWIIQIDTKVRALCTALSVTALMGSPVNLIAGTETANYYAALDATVRLLCAASGGYHAEAARFSTSASSGIASLERTLLTTVDSPTVLYSVWLRNSAAVPASTRIGYDIVSDTQFWGFFYYVDHIEFDFWAANGTSRYLMRVNSLPEFSDGNWHHVIASVDCNHAAHAKTAFAKFALNGVAKTVLEGSDTAGAFSVAWTIEAAYCGIEPGWAAGGVHSWEIADLWVGMGQYADASDPAVIEKFRDPVTGKPVYLGANGEVPTGTAPVMFFSGNGTTFGQPNLGTGGAFTKNLNGTGSIADASSSPSD